MGFMPGAGFAGLTVHAARMGLLADLFVLLMGFALLSRHFEAAEARRDACILPGDWKGGLVLLVLAFVLWAFLDDIPAALIGGTMARHVIQRKGSHRPSGRDRRGFDRQLR